MGLFLYPNFMYKLIIRPILFLFDPEKVHYFTFSLIRFLCKIPLIAPLFRKVYQINDKKLERNLFGLTFKNPVGLAAGFDKNAVLYNELANFGFGFIEIGTVTPYFRNFLRDKLWDKRWASGTNWLSTVSFLRSLVGNLFQIKLTVDSNDLDYTFIGITLFYRTVKQKILGVR
mgnify:CR=1 FL=1